MLKSCEMYLEKYHLFILQIIFAILSRPEVINKFQGWGRERFTIFIEKKKDGQKT